MSEAINVEKNASPDSIVIHSKKEEDKPKLAQIIKRTTPVQDFLEEAKEN